MNLKWREWIPLARRWLGPSPYMEQGWAEYKPDRYDENEMIRSLIFRGLQGDCRFPDEGKVVLFGSAGERQSSTLTEVLRGSPAGFQRPMEPVGFWKEFQEPVPAYLCLVLGAAPSVLAVQNQSIDLLESVFREFYAPDEQWLSQNLLQSIEQQARDTSIQPSSLIYRDKSGRFVRPDLRNETLRRMIGSARQPAKKRKKPNGWSFMQNLREGWLMASTCWFDKQSSEADRQVCLRGLVRNFSWDSGLEGVEELCRETIRMLGDHDVSLQDLDRIYISGGGQSLYHGILAVVLRRQASLSPAQFEFPDEIWGCAPLIPGLDFLIRAKDPALYLSFDQPGTVRAILKLPL